MYSLVLELSLGTHLTGKGCPRLSSELGYPMQAVLSTSFWLLSNVLFSCMSLKKTTPGRLIQEQKILCRHFSPVNIWYGLTQIATEFFSAGMLSGEVSLKHTKNPLCHLWGKQVKSAIEVTFSHYFY